MDEQKLKQAMLEDDEIEIDLIALIGDFFKIIKEYWGIFIGIVIITTVAFSVFKYLTYSPIYRCSATFTVATSNEENSNQTSYDYYYSKNTADQLSKTFPYILESSHFKNILLNELGVQTLNGTLSASTVSESNLVTMSVTSNKPQDAMSILITAIDVYPEAAKFVLGDIQFHMVNNAQMPTVPYNQLTLTKTIGLGGTIGVVIGIAVLALMALFRRTVKTPEQMSKITNLKCLATIPKVKFKARKTKNNHYISILDRRISYGYKESMRSLQIRLERLLKREKQKIIVVTSSASNEGKSTISINLALTLATNGNKVLLIDGDLRKQELAKVLNCQTSKNLKDLIKNDDVLKGISKLEVENLSFIGNNEPDNNPIEILTSRNLKEYLNKVKQHFDYVLIDTPPCGIFQDARLFQECADALLYVVKYDYMPHQKIQEGLSLLNDDNCLMGYLFNVYSKKSPDYGYGKYGYGYSGYRKYSYGEKNKE